MDIEHHLGEIVKEVKGSLFAELPLSQGEEAGLLLNDVTANNMNRSVLNAFMVNSTISFIRGVNFDSLEYVLAIASFHAAPLGTFVRESLKQSLCLVLVLKDTPAKIIGLIAMKTNLSLLSSLFVFLD